MLQTLLNNEGIYSSFTKANLKSIGTEADLNTPFVPTMLD
jgi:hypothetical protein